MNKSEQNRSSYASVKIAGNVLVVVPDDIRLITPFVLREQEDWFEDEIKFLRSWIHPGMQVLDIGANFGVYSLMMAREVGESGVVLAIEPARSVLDFLELSCRANGFENVVPIEAALSDKEGEAQLAVYANSEKNTLHARDESPLAFFKVPVLTLDGCVARYAQGRLDFIKIDAEGEEVNIIAGGVDTLSDHSPLVMYEFREGSRYNHELVERFSALGYHSYRLVPGQNVLIPFDHGSPFDHSQLNLFCCKADRASSMVEAGFMVENPRLPEGRLGFSWRDYLASKPYGTALLEGSDAMQEIGEGLSGDYARALDLFSVSQSDKVDAGMRMGALLESLDIMEDLAAREPTVPRLMTLARLLEEVGFYSRYVETVEAVVQQLDSSESEIAEWEEPFIAPHSHFDNVDPDGRMQQWCLAALLFGIEQHRSPSAYFVAEHALVLLDRYKLLGFPDIEMERRRQLILMALGRQAGPLPCEELCRERDENLNREYWCGNEPVTG